MGSARQAGELFRGTAAAATRQLLRTTSASQVMTAPARCVPQDESCAGTLRKLQGEASLPVIDGSGRVVGQLREIDVLRAGRGGSARSFMSPFVLRVRHSDTLDTVVSMMREERAQCVVVCDDEGRAIGVITATDVMGWLGGLGVAPAPGEVPAAHARQQRQM